VLKGDAAFSYRKDVIKPQSLKKERSTCAQVFDDLSPEQAALLACLKDKRTELARERDKPAYIIFSDRSLEDMARQQPQTLDAFADIHGVGAAKLKEFAATFLAVITQHASP
jgi:ATP-dependent DNA helicase RecQ